MARLREMEMFVRVVEGGSFSAAAGDLNMARYALGVTTFQPPAINLPLLCCSGGADPAASV